MYVCPNNALYKNLPFPHLTTVNDPGMKLFFNVNEKFKHCLIYTVSLCEADLDGSRYNSPPATGTKCLLNRKCSRKQLAREKQK